MKREKEKKGIHEKNFFFFFFTQRWGRNSTETALPAHPMASLWIITSKPLGSPCAQCLRHMWGMELQTPAPTATLTGIPTLNENHNHRKLIKLITLATTLFNSMKLWHMPCRATQDGQVMVEISDKTWSTGEGNGKPIQYSCLENLMNTMKKQ